ncbi:Ribosomal protein [Parasponia andersonii]|uniref:Ribosomal protein n=1 Tax=Parasponia andersonii TaxID=3476 RepID=A0A2P5E3R9_PARAD|nr:Ribosomal protein [Parasponia andersonii]
MRHLIFSTTTTTMPASSSSSSSSSVATSSSSTSSKPSKSSNSNPSSSLLCKHSPSATLDLLILILVLFSGSFLLTSYFSYIFNSLSLLLSSTSSFHGFHLQLPYIVGFVAFFCFAVFLVGFCCGARSRKCDKPGCKGLKKAMEFDLKLQNEDSIKAASSKEIDRLPWKGGTESNPDYECLRSELRKMAPPDGRAVLLFRARCGCPVAKLEGWGPKRGRRHKKALASAALKGGDHH